MGGHQASADKRRRHTVFEPCLKHSSWFAFWALQRAEVFVEGGPADSPCAGGLCQIKPGRNFYSIDFVDAHKIYTGAMWKPNGVSLQVKG